MKLFFLVLVSTFVLATESQIYYAKAEAKVEYVVKSEVNGKVLFVNKKFEGKNSTGEVLIRIDNFTDKVNLQNAKNRLKFSKTILSSTNQSLKNFREILRLKKANLQKINSLRSRSSFEKDIEKINLLNIENSYQQVSQQKQQTLSTISDLEGQIKILQDNIKKKTIKVSKGLYIYSIDIQKDDFVSVGRAILKIFDLSKAKLTIFVALEKFDEIKKQKIYIDGKLTNYKIDKIWKVADSQNISSYKVEILIDAPKVFSKLKKIQFQH